MTEIYIKETHSKFFFNNDDERIRVIKFLEGKFTFKDTSMEREVLVKRGLVSPYKCLYNKEFDLLPTGLVPFARVHLKQAGIDFKIFDERKRVKYDKEAISEEFELNGYYPRDYQVESIQAVVKKKGGIINLPVGSGKGLILAHLCRVYNKSKIICLFDSVDLIHQTYSNFTDKYGFDENEVGFIQGNNYKEGRVILLSVQSYAKAMHLFPNVRCIFMDECHSTGRTETAEKVIYACQNASIKVGLTATTEIDNPYEKMKMFSNTGPIVYKKEIVEQIEQDHLSKVNIEIQENGFEGEVEITGSWNDIYDTKSTSRMKEETIQSYIEDGYDYDENNNKLRKFLDYGDESNHYIYNAERNRKIVEAARKHKRVLILYDKKKHGEEIVKLLNEKEYFMVDGNSSSKERQEAKEFLSDKEDSIVLASKIFFTGVDIPEIETVIMANSSVSTIRIIQRLGRGVRKSKDKDGLIVVDFFDKMSKLSIKQSEKRLKVYRQLGLPISIISN